jgi:Fe-S oxidoreductase
MRVGFFVTCLVDLMRPSIGFAALKLLEAGGADVYVPAAQTCCGQPAYNSGDRAHAVALASKVVAEFEDCDYLVAPSGSCGGMIKTHYADLFSDDPGDGGPRGQAGREDLRTHRLPGQRSEVRDLSGYVRGHDNVSRLLCRLARNGREVATAHVAGQAAGRAAG